MASIALASLFAYRAGFSQGVEVGLATGSQLGQVSQGVGALSIIRHLEAGRHDAALSELDAQVDAGISAHWIRLQAPSGYAASIDSPAELVAYLERYRRSRPSTARSQTPTMNRLVAEYLDHRDHHQ